MPDNRLTIIKSDSNDRSSFQPSSTPTRQSRMRELKAKFERLWLTDPERFNPLRNCMERERLLRTEQFISKRTSLVNKQTVDIGCAAGVFAHRLKDLGANVEAVDIAENALKQFKKMGSEGIKLKQEAMPDTTLPDHGYDVIVCTDLIAEIPKEEYRLFFAELSRLIKPDGILFCSSAIDIGTEGGVEKLISLAQTEFDIFEDESSYHALYLRLKGFFAAPAAFVEGWKNQEVKQKELASRQGFSKGWYELNSSAPLAWLWLAIEPCTRPIRSLIKNSRNLLLFSEKICRFTSDQAGISHYLFMAKRRKIQMTDESDIPVQRLGKKEVWE